MVIESADAARDGKNTRILSFVPGGNHPLFDAETWRRKEEIETWERMWDVVGDQAIAKAIAEVRGDEVDEGICCLIPGAGEAEGVRYSKDVLRRLLGEADSRWKYVIFDGYGVESGYGIPMFSTYNWKYTLRRELEELMNDKPSLMSLEEYRRSIGNTGSKMTPHREATAISPVAGGTNHAISRRTRQKVLNFAHPVDAEIIRKLDNPAINGVFNKVVQTGIDASYGLALATGIHLSPSTYPELYEVVKECADALGIPVPYVIISDTVRGINACTAGTDQFAFIAISSLLPLVMKRDELKFVIGHECGHLALGHVVYHTAITMMGAAGGLLPLVGNIIAKTITYPLNAWSRRSEISADRAGLICCGDVTVAKRTLFKLEAGILNADSVDIDNYVRESEQVLEGTSIGKLAEYTMSHPIIPKRIKALDLFARSELYARINGAPVDGRRLSDAELTRDIEKIIAVM